MLRKQVPMKSSRFSLSLKREEERMGGEKNKGGRRKRTREGEKE